MREITDLELVTHDDERCKTRPCMACALEVADHADMLMFVEEARAPGPPWSPAGFQADVSNAGKWWTMTIPCHAFGDFVAEIWADNETGDLPKRGESCTLLFRNLLDDPVAIFRCEGPDMAATIARRFAYVP